MDNKEADFIKNLSTEQREKLVLFLQQMRRDLADGVYLRKHFYTEDNSRLAGNTHHYWLRLGLNAELRPAITKLLPPGIPDDVAQWLLVELEQKIFARLPAEYSTLIKLPFSVPIGEVGDERAKRIAQTIKRRLPTITPYCVFHHQINRLLQSCEVVGQNPDDAEVDLILTRQSKRAIAKSRRRFPEVWDEVRGHYVLDSRGAQFARKLVQQLVSRGFLSATTRFVDIGSGVGTNLFAVNRYSASHATGVELHKGVFELSKVTDRRLDRIGVLDSNRIELHCGDAFDRQIIDLSDFDVIYVYSSLGKSEIDIDQVVDCAKPGAVIIFNALPTRCAGNVEALESVAELFAFRKKAS